MGTLYVVGLGPGAEDLLTPRARRALERAQAVVGYERYTELVRRWLPAASLHPSPI
ncbi:MAG: precorrin-3B C(17)-methyltransferase, partial [Chloroflexota bacterium]